MKPTNRPKTSKLIDRSDIEDLIFQFDEIIHNGMDPKTRSLQTSVLDKIKKKLSPAEAEELFNTTTEQWKNGLIKFFDTTLVSQVPFEACKNVATAWYWWGAVDWTAAQVPEWTTIRPRVVEYARQACEEVVRELVARTILQELVDH